MIRKDLGGVYVSVISHQREHEIARITEIIGPATWYVGAGEANSYKLFGAPAVIESGGLCRSRNAALDDGFRLKAPVLELSDDLKSLAQAYALPGGKKEKRTITFKRAVNLLQTALHESGAMMAGAAPTSNLFYWQNKTLSEKHFIVGDFILIQPTDLRFDESLRLKEDYDYTLAHIKKYGKVARRDDLLVEFAHRNNAGGAVAYRTSALEQESIKKLKSKWGPLIKDNPRRPNEVLINSRAILG